MLVIPFGGKKGARYLLGCSASHGPQRDFFSVPLKVLNRKI